MQLRPVQSAAALAGVCLWLITGAASATIINLSDGNSAVDIEDSYASMDAWAVDGTGQLYLQNFLYRVGPTAPNTYVGIPDLSLSSSTTFLGSRGLELVYDEPSGDFTITITYLLTGGPAASGQSLLAQEISILNTSGGDLDFHFFQVADFDLNGTPLNDTVELVNANTVRQWEGSLVLEETVVTPAPNHFSADARSTVSTDVELADFLNDNAGPTGPADVAWAFQWDEVLADGDALLISKNLRIEVVPIPAAAWLFGSALGLLGWMRRKTA